MVVARNDVDLADSLTFWHKVKNQDIYFGGLTIRSVEKTMLSPSGRVGNCRT